MHASLVTAGEDNGGILLALQKLVCPDCLTSYYFLHSMIEKSYNKPKSNKRTILIEKAMISPSLINEQLLNPTFHQPLKNTRSLLLTYIFTPSMEIRPCLSSSYSMTSAAESNELFLSALWFPVCSMSPNSGMVKVIVDMKLLKPVLFSEPSQNSIGVLCKSSISFVK